MSILTTIFILHDVITPTINSMPDGEIGKKNFVLTRKKTRGIFIPSKKPKNKHYVSQKPGLSKINNNT